MNIGKKKQSTLLALLLVTCGLTTVSVAQTPVVIPRTSVQEASRREATTTALTAYNIVFDARRDGWCNFETAHHQITSPSSVLLKF